VTLAPKPARTLAPKPAGTYAGLYDLHIAPYLGQLKLAALTPEVIARWQAERLRAGAGRSSIHKTLTLLGASLQRAVESGRIARNPARLVREASRPARREVRPLAPATVEALRQASGARDATRISVLAYAGLRPQEALALRWEDVRERTILVDIRLAQARLRPHRRRPASRAPRRTRCATARFAAAARRALDDLRRAPALARRAADAEHVRARERRVRRGAQSGREGRHPVRTGHPVCPWCI
jgi:integrase